MKQKTVYIKATELGETFLINNMAFTAWLNTTTACQDGRNDALRHMQGTLTPVNGETLVSAYKQYSDETYIGDLGDLTDGDFGYIFQFLVRELGIVAVLKVARTWVHEAIQGYRDQQPWEAGPRWCEAIWPQFTKEIGKRELRAICKFYNPTLRNLSDLLEAHSDLTAADLDTCVRDVWHGIWSVGNLPGDPTAIRWMLDKLHAASDEENIGLSIPVSFWESEESVPYRRYMLATLFEDDAYDLIQQHYPHDVFLRVLKTKKVLYTFLSKAALELCEKYAVELESVQDIYHFKCGCAVIVPLVVGEAERSSLVTRLTQRINLNSVYGAMGTPFNITVEKGAPVSEKIHLKPTGETGYVFTREAYNADNLAALRFLNVACGREEAKRRLIRGCNAETLAALREDGHINKEIYDVAVSMLPKQQGTLMDSIEPHPGLYEYHSHAPVSKRDSLWLGRGFRGSSMFTVETLYMPSAMEILTPAILGPGLSVKASMCDYL